MTGSGRSGAIPVASSTDTSQPKKKQQHRQRATFIGSNYLASRSFNSVKLQQVPTNSHSGIGEKWYWKCNEQVQRITVQR